MTLYSWIIIITHGKLGLTFVTWYHTENLDVIKIKLYVLITYGQNWPHILVLHIAFKYTNVLFSFLFVLILK